MESPNRKLDKNVSFEDLRRPKHEVTNPFAT